MEFNNAKIFLKSLLCLVILCLSALAFAGNDFSLGGGGSGYSASTEGFIKPQYNEKTHLLEYVLSAASAKMAGMNIVFTNVKIEMIGSDGKTVKAVMTTPTAIYNRVTQFISGDDPIRVQSLTFDASGIGFDFSQVAKTLHIRKNVKLYLKSTSDVRSEFAISSSVDSEKQTYKSESSDLGKKIDTSTFKKQVKEEAIK